MSVLYPHSCNGLAKRGHWPCGRPGRKRNHCHICPGIDKISELNLRQVGSWQCQGAHHLRVLIGDVHGPVDLRQSCRSKTTVFLIPLISPKNTGTKRHELSDERSWGNSDRGTRGRSHRMYLACEICINDSQVNKDSLKSGTRSSHEQCTQSLAQRSKGIQRNLMHTSRV
ncbi:hypothetical protein TURU_016964 [Turdus rufiventris]|nr:hypothetical protein TURU_016964 [Turdus rufiventris]